MTDFGRPTRAQLVVRDRADLNARIPGGDSNLRRTLLNGVATMHAGAMDGAYGYLDYIADQIIPDSADLAHLIRWASYWGVTPKTPQPAAGTATSTGISTNGTPVPAGTVLQRGDQFDYVTTADAVVADNVVQVQLTASTPGSIGLADQNTQLTLVNPIAGVVSAFLVDAAGLTGGTDAETPPELLARLEFRVQNPPSGGGPGDYERWATQVAGVTRAWEYPLWSGLGTVGLAFVFDDRADIIPLAADVAAMQAYIDAVCPLTAVFTAFAPLQDPVAFTIHLAPDTPALRTAVTAELADLFVREAQPLQEGSTILESHYDDAVGAAVGSGDYTITAPVGNIAVAAYTLATLGAITWV